MKTLRIVMKGHVFGVGFRFHTQHNAYQLGIKGTVQNVYDEDYLEIYAQGKKKDLDKFIETIKKGTALSNIEKFSMSELEQTPYEDFRILW